MHDLTQLEAELIRDRLLKRLAARQHDIAGLHDYYDGNHRLPPLPEKCNTDVKALRDHSLLNLCPLVVNAVDERLEVQGLQFGGTPTDGVDVWESVWQPNQLDAVSGLVMQEALIARRAFCMVWPDDVGGVNVFPEVPSEALVEYEPGTRSRRRFGIKRFAEGAGTDATVDVTVWTDSEVWHWRSDPDRPKVLLFDPAGYGENPLGSVPLVEFLSLPDLRGLPHSELDRGVVKIQDRINKTIFDRLVLQEYQAFPQRWTTGIEPEVDDNGIAIAPFRVGPNRIAVNESDTVKFGQWDAADLKPLLDATSADIHALAAVTKTPVHYLAAEFSNVSADAIRAAEAGLINKVRGHQRTFGESWEEVMRLALRAIKDERSEVQSSFVIWKDPESRTVAEEADAAVKLAPLLPQSTTWERLGYSPQAISAMQAQMVQQALTADLSTRVPPVTRSVQRDTDGRVARIVEDM